MKLFKRAIAITALSLSGIVSCAPALAYDMDNYGLDLQASEKNHPMVCSVLVDSIRSHSMDNRDTQLLRLATGNAELSSRIADEVYDFTVNNTNVPVDAAKDVRAVSRLMVILEEGVANNLSRNNLVDFCTKTVDNNVLGKDINLQAGIALMGEASENSE